MDPSHSIDELFAAAFAPERWADALEAFARGAGAEGATLVFGASTPESVAVSRTLAPVVREYFEAREVDDPREDRVRPSIHAAFQTDFDFFSADEIAADPFYQEFLRPHGFGWHGVTLLAAQPTATLLSLKRAYNRGPYERAELAALDYWVPHLRSIARSVEAAHAAQMRSQLASLEHFEIGALTLDRHGQVIDRNAALTLEDGLSLASGAPRASHRLDQPVLAAAIEQALRPERPSRRAPPRRVTLRRPSGRRPLIIELMPLIEPGALSLFRAAALMTVTDLDRPLAPGIADLREIFGLTLREAELASHLASGKDIEHAATELCISKAHARQRLKTVFQKTDTHRQAELVALLARLRRHTR
jgi:DNA-binding CsgD family transcriptional regulator